MWLTFLGHDITLATFSNCHCVYISVSGFANDCLGWLTHGKKHAGSQNGEWQKEGCGFVWHNA